MVVKKEKQLQGNINKKNRNIQVLNGNRSIRLKYYYRLLHSSRHETVYILNCISNGYIAEFQTMQSDDFSIISHGYRPPVMNLHNFMCMDSL